MNFCSFSVFLQYRHDVRATWRVGQFEREVFGECIRDKIAASRKKGMCLGGFVPLLSPNGRRAGHRGNRLLRQRDPRHFRFTLLQRVSPEMDPNDVIRLEGTWKERLHTRVPHGLNDK